VRASARPFAGARRPRRATTPHAARRAPRRRRRRAQVEELAPLGVKNPMRSPLLWGSYEVLYCSKPSAVGGPLKAGAGPVLFPGQKAVQRLVQPDQLVNEVRCGRVRAACVFVCARVRVACVCA
jgi:hypothetical protein